MLFLENYTPEDYWTSLASISTANWHINQLIVDDGEVNLNALRKVWEISDKMKIRSDIGHDIGGGEGWAINIVRCIVGTMFCVLKNIVKNIDVDVFSKTSPKHRIVKEKARCFT